MSSGMPSQYPAEVPEMSPTGTASHVFLTSPHKERKLAIEFQASVGHPLSLGWTAFTEEFAPVVGELKRAVRMTVRSVEALTSRKGESGRQLLDGDANKLGNGPGR